MRYIIVLLLLTSCATNFEKSAYTCMVVTTITDMYTTHKVLEQGGRELNPILGRHPNDEALIMYGISKIALHSVLGKYSEFWRKWGYSAGCVSGTVMTIHNYGEL